MTVSSAAADVSVWLESARAMAADAGKILMNRFGGPCRTERKGVVDLVTEADRASESFLLGAIRERFYPSKARGSRTDVGARFLRGT